MHLTLVSITRKILDLPSIKSVTIPTKVGEITILPNHMPLITALVPGILTVRFDGKETSYAIGWGVVETSGSVLTIAADMIEEWSELNLEAVRAKKEEARKLLETYRDTHEVMDMDQYVELEYEFLKESAKEQLATRPQ